MIGSLLPDVLDKPIFLLGLGNGRFFSHNLLFIVISFLIVHLVFKRKITISLPFLIGLIFHMILDLPYIPLFYPFISYEFIPIEKPLQFWLEALFTNPVIIITECTGLLFFLFILIRNNLYHIRDIINYLNGINYDFRQSSKEKDFSV